MATLKFVKDKLYGREDEIRQLREAAIGLDPNEASKRENNVHIPVILVGGTSGVGKSAFVDKLRFTLASPTSRRYLRLGKI